MKYAWVGSLIVAGLLCGSAAAEKPDRDHDRDDGKPAAKWQDWRNGQYANQGNRNHDWDHDRDDRWRSDRDHDWDRDHNRRNSRWQTNNSGYWGNQNGYRGGYSTNGYYGNYGNNGRYSSYAGRLNSHDQYVYNQLYNNYLQAHQINSSAQIAKAETAMQTVYRKYGIPSNTPYSAVATGY